MPSRGRHRLSIPDAAFALSGCPQKRQTLSRRTQKPLSWRWPRPTQRLRAVALAAVALASLLGHTTGVTDLGDTAALRAFNDEVIKASGKGIPGWFPANQTSPCGDYWAVPFVLPYPGVLCPAGDPADPAPVRVVSLVLYNVGITATTIAPLTKLTELTALAILGNNITAPLPPGLRTMPKLVNIDLRNNRLTGGIPDLTGAPLKTLLLSNQTWAGDPGLTGGIPGWLGGINSLSMLDLALNSFSGPIPPSIISLPKLNTLILRGNKLTGKIPSLAPLAPTLQTLDISHNSFDPAAMPKELNNLTVVNGVLDLSYMNLIGGLINLRNLGSVVDLILDGNNLSGPLYPKNLPVGSLGYLSLKHNRFSGPIKSNLLGVINNNLYCMTTCGINFANNRFSGKLPASLGDILQAFVFDFSNNQLTGPIPNTYGYVYSMLQLKLQNNRLSGPPPDFNPPPVVTYQLMLAELDLSGNLLTGTFPEKLTRFTRLKTINIANNRMHGTIPNITALKQLLYLNISGNKFVGLPPAVPTATVLDFHTNYFGGLYTDFASQVRKSQKVNVRFNCFKCASNDKSCKKALPRQRKNPACVSFCRADTNQPPCGGGLCNFYNSSRIAVCKCPGKTALYFNSCPQAKATAKQNKTK